MSTTTTTQPAETQQQPTTLPRPAPDLDTPLALVVAALLAIGLLMAYSTTFDWSYLEYGSPLRIWLNQLRSAVVAVAVMLIAWRLDYRILRNRWLVSGIMLVTILALGALLIINNNEVLGGRRSLFEGSVQPGEAAKLAVIIYFAAWLASRREKLGELAYGLLPFAILVGTVGALIILQPDLSTAAVIIMTTTTMFFVAGANIVQIGLAAAGSGVVGWLLATQFEYARQRLVDHLAAMRDLTQASWHVQQAIIAFTAPGGRPGGSFTPNWFGVGLGESRQKFGFLPAAHTDSIFAVVGEELGVFGCLVVITLFALLVWRAFKIARQAQEPFGAVLAVGIGTWVAYEALLNIAVVTAVIPFTGVALPFISYGGSNLVAVMAGMGLLLSISRRRPLLPAPVRPGREQPRPVVQREGALDYDFSRRDKRSGGSRRGE